ncbi:MAG: phosphoglucosamine mutase, partial [Rubrobacter sp.]
GAKATDLGVLPTPGVAALAPKLRASAAVVVSASHNPYPDNGIKFLSAEGKKLPDSTEREFEDLITAGPDFDRPTGGDVGAVEVLGNASGLYVEILLERLRPEAGGMKILLDCANGAAFEVAPLAFGELGVELTVVGDEPNGLNINEGCGSTQVERLDVAGNDVAFAFDGDADRVLAVDEKGSIVDGDKMIAILARDLHERDALGGGAVVTVMSNLGFFKAMDGLSIPYEVTPVGDRYVAEAMWRNGAKVGGEQSGHIILSEYVATGDGLLTALALTDVMARSGKPLSELARVMEVYPQRLINVVVGEGRKAKVTASSDAVVRAVREAEARLGEQGRILLRPSGTEPIVRVMVEHEDRALCDEVCEAVAKVVEESG